MKISDILINEAPAANKKTGKVPPQPTLNGKPSTGPKGQAWLKKYGATHNPDGTPKAAAAPVQVAPQQGGGLTGQNAPGVAPEVGVAQASSGTTPDPVPPQEPTPTPAPTPAVTPPPEKNALGVQAQAGGAFGQQTPQADVSRAPTEPVQEPTPAPTPAPAQAQKQQPPGLVSATTAQGSSTPNGPTAQANPTGTGIGANAQVNPDTGASTVAPPVKSGTGSTWTTGSGTPLGSTTDDEFAWLRANPANMMNRGAYPGPGKWDPKTGRTKRESIEYHERDNQLLQRMRQIAGLK